MAKYERHFTGDFDNVLSFCEDTIRGGSMTASLEETSQASIGGARVALRVYERYSMLGSNRVSLSLLLAGEGNRLFLSACTSGGSQAMFFKINTFGEEAFLARLSGPLEDHLRSQGQ
jgi:hypothetical protein